MWGARIFQAWFFNSRFFRPDAVQRTAILDQKIIDDLQNLFATELTWLEEVYSLSRVGVSKEEKYPQIYSHSDGHYIDVRPNDNLRAYCFFEEGSLKVNFYEGEFGLNVSAIFWVNKSAIQGNVNELTGDVLRVISESSYAEQIGDIEVEYEDIFSKYTLSEVDTQMNQHPYAAFKVSFIFSTFVDVRCYDSFSEDTSSCEN